ncbi:hypothetical protein B0T26DRAFT_737273 [Lasiosphaeria miniovina]|uniref:Uncharacterized protein n=1 Tax=Lasiosphaeria miniovina TaxID=1954250 RepID=A0AA40ECA7_9PEZI|nr:uncharacterized protein B0T26DRAFT_737273 [Lasiosphaeria miniovina]KAK0734720.1 hypothetical protein B0T26DRAFT_737273 [Lasiosphaeria miniovina]
MVLQFIDQGAAGIGLSERRLIRSHVMKGRNAGRPRQSSKKQTGVVHIRRILPMNPPPGVLMPPCTRPLSWNDLTFATFPGELDGESRRLMHAWFYDISDSLFPSQFCDKFDIVQSVWVNCMVDEASNHADFHSTLAISASYLNFFQRRTKTSSKDLQHVSKAYALVNRKLSGPDSLSDGAIAAVASLAIYQQIHHQFSTGRVHLDGLWRMIELRGGIARLMRERRPLAIKPLRLDVELALQTGAATLFRGDELPLRPVLCCDPRVTIVEPQYAADGATAAPRPLKQDVTSFARLLGYCSNSSSKRVENRVRVKPLDFAETLVWLLYRLVAAAPPLTPTTGVETCSQDDLVHLAMLAFMTSLLPGYGAPFDSHDAASAAGYYPLLADRLESAIQGQAPHSYVAPATSDWDIAPATSDWDSHDSSDDCDGTTAHLLRPFLWALFMGGITILKRHDRRQWLSVLIVRTCARLGLHEWPAIYSQLSEFPWIDTLHSAQGRHLWEDAKHGHGGVSE